MDVHSRAVVGLFAELFPVNVEFTDDDVVGIVTQADPASGNVLPENAMTVRKALAGRFGFSAASVCERLDSLAGVVTSTGLRVERIAPHRFRIVRADAA